MTITISMSFADLPLWTNHYSHRKETGNTFTAQAMVGPKYSTCVVVVECHANVSSYIGMYSVIQELPPVRPDLQIHMQCEPGHSYYSR